jgi:hypothetical protein
MLLVLGFNSPRLHLPSRERAGLPEKVYVPKIAGYARQLDLSVRPVSFHRNYI